MHMGLTVCSVHDLMVGMSRYQFSGEKMRGNECLLTYLSKIAACERLVEAYLDIVFVVPA